MSRADHTIWDATTAARAWLDAGNGTADLELTCRILKVTEEAGEAAAAWIGTLGQNPRKGVTHTREQVADELADVAFTALVAIASLGFDPRLTVERCAGKITERLDGLGQKDQGQLDQGLEDQGSVGGQV